jgi:hypothetical protein
MDKIWKYENGFNKVYVEDIDEKDEILSVKGCKLHCTYYKNGTLKAWDIIYPISQDKKIKIILKQVKKEASRK